MILDILTTNSTKWQSRSLKKYQTFLENSDVDSLTNSEFLRYFIQKSPSISVQNKDSKLFYITQVNFFYFNLNKEIDRLEGYKDITETLKMFPLPLPGESESLDEELERLHKEPPYKETSHTKPRKK